MITTILIIYAWINAFICGFNFARQYNNSDTLKEKISAYIWAVLTMFFGVIIVVAIFIYALFAWLFQKLDGVFQFRFLFDYFVMKKWYNVDYYILERINYTSINVKNKNTIKHRIYRYSVGLINKRNNYIYQELST
jgi:hypothetical protein